jgi:cell division septal protein FtsQ
MGKLFQKIRRTAADRNKPDFGKNGIDAGRAAFGRVNDSDKQKKKNLLKKLNLYWSQKKSTSRRGYSESPPKGGWRRKIVLTICLAISVTIFIKVDGLKSSAMLLQNLDYFRITAIDIEGCVNTSELMVRDAAGIAVSTSQFSVDIDKVAADIKKENSWVSSVSISRRWPEKLVVKISEYKPHALITVDRENEAVLHYLDRSGEPFIRTQTGMDLDYPIITGLERERDEAQLSEKLKQPLYFLHLVGANNPNLPAQSVSEIHIDEEEGLVVYLVEYPFPIFLGRDDIRKKYVRLRRILEVLYKPRKMGMDIARVAYIRMDYLKDKVIVGYSESG